ncbi:MAG TPA: CHAD domain-containing protein [Rhodopila sp.]|uniref:CYTH and CHAD domain-containing protein n=1 Tax=Rhodopila sp. TaxID=2480087 RepID=UPI002D14B423|nr:CHAD domain-containing protein [Rhodopila sp.]HVY15659.1 CHAD domain-containing protein [Rhodopila sp.]
MEFELAVTAEAAGAVPRLKPLVACRDGRPRSQAIRAIWYDSPDRTLLGQGQTLVETRGAWRLKRLFPGAEIWLPGQPAPVVAEGQDMASLSDLPSPLAPLVAFEGRRGLSVHVLAGGSVTLAVARGTLRAVTAERPAARIRLSGDEAAVREAALMIAAAVPVSLPRETLAAEGIALATGWQPGPRRAGAPELPETARTVDTALAHIMGHLLDALLWHTTRLDQGPEAVHQMRVAVRRARSAVSLFRPAFAEGALDPLRAPLKALNARFGATRDWDVFTGETLPAIRATLPDDERLARLAAAADRRRREHHKALDTWLGSQDFRLLTIELAWLIASDTWRKRAAPGTAEPGDNQGGGHGSDQGRGQGAEPGSEQPETDAELTPFAEAVLQKRWKRLTSSGKEMDDLDIPELHAVRLRAKQTRYAAEMFGALFDGKGPHRFIRRLSILQERLGVLNDGAVAASLLAELGGPGGRFGYAVGVVTGFMAARAEKLRPRIAAAFAKFRRQDPYWS